jgi:hypothetical protein
MAIDKQSCMYIYIYTYVCVGSMRAEEVQQYPGQWQINHCPLWAAWHRVFQRVDCRPCILFMWLHGWGWLSFLPWWNHYFATRDQFEELYEFLPVGKVWGYHSPPYEVRFAEHSNMFILMPGRFHVFQVPGTRCRIFAEPRISSVWTPFTWRSWMQCLLFHYEPIQHA